MHTLAPYTIRCFDQTMSGPVQHRHAILDKVGQFDTFDLLERFISANTNYTVIDNDKVVYRFNGFEFDKTKRVAYGWLESGTYGIKTEIIDVNTGDVDFIKAQQNAEIIRHFVFIFMPEGANESIALLQAYRGNGVKTIFHEKFGEYFNTKTTRNLQMRPLAYDKALDNWLDGQAKEIKLVNFNTKIKDVADSLNGLGHEEAEMILKPVKRASFGTLKQLLDPKSSQAKAVEIAKNLCERVTTVVKVGDRKKTFIIGGSAENIVCEIAAPDDLDLVDGNPTYNAMYEWCKEVCREYAGTMYVNVPAKLLP